jgi:hypothetical protein
MTKIAESESGSICQRPGSADPDPDPRQNVMDLQHCYKTYDPRRQKKVGKAWHETLLSPIFSPVDFSIC